MNEPDVPSIGGDLLMRIRSVMPRLPETALKVARQVLDDPAIVLSSPIAELAMASNTSQASVTRFCQALGLSGYQELKLRLASELGRSPALRWNVDMGAEIEPGDPPERMATVLAGATIRVVQQTLELLDTEAVDQASSRIVAARRIHLVGVGGSGVVAQELQMRLARLGLAVWVHVEAHSALVAAALSRPDDAFVLISRSGRTSEVLEAAGEAASNGATILAITSFPQSPVAAAAGTLLLTPVQDTAVRHGSLAARYAQLFVADCLYTAVAQKIFEESADALAATSRALAPHRNSSRRPLPVDEP